MVYMVLVTFDGYEFFYAKGGEKGKKGFDRDQAGQHREVNNKT